MRKFIWPLVLIIFIGGCAKQKPEEMDLRIVAKAGDVEFTMYLLDTYMIRMNYADPDDELYKKTDFLEQQLDKLILADDGIKRGLLDSVEVDSSQVSRILYEMVYKRRIADNLNFKDKDVKKFWEKYGGEVHLAQIMVLDIDLADSLADVLDREPEKFAELAEEFSQDDVTKANGGDLGWRRVNHIPDELREPVFSLKQDEISQPVYSSFGIHLIKMIERRKHTEQDFKIETSNYRQAYSAFLRDKLEQEFFKSIKDDMNYRIFWEPIQVIIDKALKNREEKYTPQTPLSNCISANDLTVDEKESIVASIDGFDYRGEMFLNELKRNTRREGINFDKKQVTEKLLSRLMLYRMMSEYGRKIGLMNMPEYAHQYEHTKVGLVFSKMQSEYLLDTVFVTDEEVRERYEKSKRNYEEPEQIKCSEIFVETEEEAQAILDQLRKGVSFSQLVKKTVRPGFAETGGNLGFCSERRFRPVYEAARGKKVGQYAGPINWDGKWAVIRINEKRPKHIKPLSEVENEIRTMTLGSKKYTVFHDYVDSLKKNIEYFIDEDLIKDNLITGKI